MINIDARALLQCPFYSFPFHSFQPYFETLGPKPPLLPVLSSTRIPGHLVFTLILMHVRCLKSYFRREPFRVCFECVATGKMFMLGIYNNNFDPLCMFFLIHWISIFSFEEILEMSWEHSNWKMFWTYKKLYPSCMYFSFHLKSISKVEEMTPVKQKLYILIAEPGSWCMG